MWRNRGLLWLLRIGIFTLLMIFPTAKPVYAYDETEIEYFDRFTYKDEDGVSWNCYETFINEKMYATVYGCNYKGPELVIPETVIDNAGNELTVANITSYEEINSGYKAGPFRYNGTELVEIYFPDSVFIIGQCVFYAEEQDPLYGSTYSGNPAFRTVQKISLPDNPNLEICKKAFACCGSGNELSTKIIFGNNPVMIDYRAFADCTEIQTLNLPEGCTEIDDYAFCGCVNVKQIINHPSNHLYLAYDSEEYDDETVVPDTLNTIVYDQSLTEIDGADRHPELTTVTMPPNCTDIGEGFQFCPKLTTINNMDLTLSGLEYCSAPFKGCSSLPLGHVIWKDSFGSCDFRNSGLVSITLPADMWVAELGDYGEGLSYCPNLTTINMSGGSEGSLKSVDGVLYWKAYARNSDTGNYEWTGKWILWKYPAAKNVGGSFTVPSDVVSLGNVSFEGTRLSEIHIPITVERIPYLDEIEGFDDYDEPYESYAFTNSGDSLKIYVVKGSYADASLRDLHGVIYEYGPSVKIRYYMQGGTNNPSNPASFTAGKAITLKNPTREGYRFLGWKRYSDVSWYLDIPYQPDGEQLIDGVNFVADWEKSGSIDDVKLSKEKIEILALDDYTLSLTNLPSGATVKWTSSATNVCTVDNNGKVHALKYGKAVISAQVTAGGKTKTLKCNVQTRFRDVPDTSVGGYTHIYWAADNGITGGIDGGVNFGPEQSCTREQFVIFLWKLSGSPAPKSTKLSFSDTGSLKATSTKAIAWAVEKNIIGGFKDGTFKPKNAVTRQQAVIMLWRAAGKKVVSGTLTFKDTKNLAKGSTAYNAILWANKTGVVKGYSADNTFRPDNNCLRNQIAVMLHKYSML